MKIQVKVRCPMKAINSPLVKHGGEEVTVDVEGSKKMVELIMDAVVQTAEENQLEVC